MFEKKQSGKNAIRRGYNRERIQSEKRNEEANGNSLCGAIADESRGFRQCSGNGWRPLCWPHTDKDEWAGCFLNAQSQYTCRAIVANAESNCDRLMEKP